MGISRKRITRRKRNLGVEKDRYSIRKVEAFNIIMQTQKGENTDSQRYAPGEKLKGEKGDVASGAGNEPMEKRLKEHRERS